MITHALEAIRDIPASCNCDWKWVARMCRFTRASLNPACPWHSPEAGRAA